jgi:hypothetical protein
MLLALSPTGAAVILIRQCRFVDDGSMLEMVHRQEEKRSAFNMTKVPESTMVRYPPPVSMPAHSRWYRNSSSPGTNWYEFVTLRLALSMIAEHQDVEIA